MAEYLSSNSEYPLVLLLAGVECEVLLDALNKLSETEYTKSHELNKLIKDLRGI